MLVLLCASGCGGFAARRIAQAPNTYPKWLAPAAPVTLSFNEKLRSAFPNEYLQVAAPEARIRYQVIPPADYQFRWTNRMNEAKGRLDLAFSAEVANLADQTNRWSASPRGTVFLLHGYGVSSFAMLPWAFILAQEGWSCVLVDLRGHGKSTGKRVYFGVQEVSDLAALLDYMQGKQELSLPVSVVGHSFGAALALRWSLTDPRVGKVVAMSPYADLSNAALNISDEYAPWLPKWFVKAGLRKLPALLQASPGELNPASWMEQSHDLALFVAGGADKIAPVDQVELLRRLAGHGNPLLVVPNAAHEPLPFYLKDLADPIIHWLSEETGSP